MVNLRSRAARESDSRGVGTGAHVPPDGRRNPNRGPNGYNLIALPIAAGVFYPALGLILRPGIAALTMTGSTVIATFNALLLKRLRLPTQQTATPPPRAVQEQVSAGIH